MDIEKLNSMPNVMVGNYFVESTKDATVKEENGEWYIEGPFAQGNIKNNNGRVYPSDVLSHAVEQYVQERVNKNRALCELGHPDSPKINLDKTCALVTNMDRRGDDWYGRAKVLHDDCPMGKILRGLVRSGVNVGVSTRGLGSANRSRWNEEKDVNVVDKFVMRAVDVVADPSGPDCYVNAIQEEKQYILDGSSDAVFDLNEETYKMFESKLSVMPVREDDKADKMFESIKFFLNSIKANTK